MRAQIARFVREDEGQDIIEYALLAAFISIVAIGVIGAIGAAVNVQYTAVQTAIE